MLGRNKALIFFNDIQSSSAWPPVPQNYPSFNGGPWECACTTLLIVSGYFVMCHTAHLTKSFFLKYRYILHNCSIQCIALESTLVSVLEGSSPYRIAGFIRQTTRILLRFLCVEIKEFTWFDPFCICYCSIYCCWNMSVCSI